MNRCLCFAFASIALAAINDPVRTDGGLVSGSPGNDPGIRVYKGIPYAKPPVSTPYPQYDPASERFVTAHAEIRNPAP